MSSPTTAQSYHAVIHRHGQTTGPIRMPLQDSDAFVAEFNRRYHSSGLQIIPIAASPQPFTPLLNVNLLNKHPAVDHPDHRDR